MVTYGNKIYCDAHFAMYRNIESLCCTPKTNILLYVKYTLTFKKKF